MQREDCDKCEIFQNYIVRSIFSFLVISEGIKEIATSLIKVDGIPASTAVETFKIHMFRNGN